MRTPLALVLLTGAAVSAQAQTFALWNFNSSLTAASSGINAASATVTRPGATSVSSVAGTGSSDPGTPNNAANYTTFPLSGGDKTSGTAYTVTLAGRAAANPLIQFSFDARWSNTASKFFTVQYFTNVSATPVDLGSLVGPGDTTFKNNNFYSVPAASLGAATSITFRIVSTFAPGTTSYAPNATGSTYGSGGTFRNDMVRIAAVPEPASMAVLGLGLAALKRRRKSAK